jgi:hypothetical protein
LRQIGRIGGGECERAEQQVGGDQCGLAAIAIADPAEHRRAEQHADVAGAEHRAERAARNPPGRDEMRRGEGDRANVVAVDQGEQNRPGQQSDLERAQPALIDQTRNLNLRFVGHRFPPRSQRFLVVPAKSHFVRKG